MCQPLEMQREMNKIIKKRSKQQTANSSQFLGIVLIVQTIVIQHDGHRCVCVCLCDCKPSHCLL